MLGEFIAFAMVVAAFIFVLGVLVWILKLIMDWLRQ
jgi:preprotein translocase subunit Sss1